MLTLLTGLALLFTFLNGYRDMSSILAGVIASRAIHPRLALYMAAAAEFVAPLVFQAAVAQTIATGLIDPQAIHLETLVVAMLATTIWTLIAWRRGIPSSSSHALVGGLLGATLVMDGMQAVIGSGLMRVVLPLFLAPPLGMLVGYIAMQLFLLAFQRATPRVNTLFRRLQTISMLFLATVHSANDAQKSMGIIVLGMVIAGKLDAFTVPLEVQLACAAAIAAGASRGDWHLIRTLGGKIYRIRPLNALASQAASAGVVLSASLFGAPVSTSQVISMALMGAGAAERVSKVRWQVGIEMLTTWALTIPSTMLISAAIYATGQGFAGLKLIANRIITWLAST